MWPKWKIVQAYRDIPYDKFYISIDKFKVVDFASQRQLSTAMLREEAVNLL